MACMVEDMLVTRDVLTHMGENIKRPSFIVTDSKAVYDLMANAGASKHNIPFEHWLHVRTLQLRGVIEPALVSAVDMQADDKTKVVDKNKFIMCRRAIMNLGSRIKDIP